MSVRSRSARLPPRTADATSVTCCSRSGSIPLTLMNASPLRVVASALPRMDGAAATTRGKAASLRASASGSSKPPRATSQTYTCASEPVIRSRSSRCIPVISASATTSAITPSVTPSVDISEMSEMNACRRRASR